MATNFDLIGEWLLFVDDFAASMLDPKPAANGGGFLITQPLFRVHDYGLEGSLVSLIRTHGGPFRFVNGLPKTPHDVGYDLWAVEISITDVTCVVVIKGQPHKAHRKVKRFNAMVANDDAFAGLRRFNLPIKVRFEYVSG